jgi:uncharacterized protein (TIGR02466 family)
MNQKIFPIFPIYYYRSTIGRDFINDDEKSIISFHSNNVLGGVGNHISVEKNVLDKHKELNYIKNKVNGCIGDYVKTIIDPKYECQFYITQSWLNYTNTGEYHKKHNHQNSIISGVVYLNAKKEYDNIVFYKEINPAQFYTPPKKYNEFNAESWEVPVNTGDIIIFPSSLTHEVKLTTADHTRISLAFNVFLRGNLGEYNNATFLHLK